MDTNVIECDLVERDPGLCMCKDGHTLEILNEVQKAYEDRMERIEKTGGSKKLQMQVDLMRSWVSDLVGQNTLLARAVEELEMEATTKIIAERRKYSEMVCEMRAECVALRRRLARKDSDLRGLVEVLRRLREFDYCTLDGIHFFEVTESDIFGNVEWREKKLDHGDGKRTYNFKPDTKKIDKKNNLYGSVNELRLMNDSLLKENAAKDREIRKLNKDMQQYEQTIMGLRKEMSFNYHTPDTSKKDAEVMADVCSTGAEGDWQHVKDCNELLREEVLKYQERIQEMEETVKASGENVRAVRKTNVTLTKEAQALRQVCVALDEQCRAANMRANFKDEIIREMRRQLKQAKAKEQTPRAIMRHATSTPNSSFGICNEDLSTDISIIKPQSITAITVNDASTSNNLIKTESQNNTQKTSKHRVRIISPEESVSAMINLKHEDSFDTANSDISGSETNCDGSIHKDSVGRSSGPASASGECDATRAEYYHNKLVATMQILQNKEETVRIQAESLAVAEARIASLTARGVELKKEIDNKTRELRALQKTIDSSKVERTDVSTSPNVQELEQQKIMVATLQNNLRIIEDLYRECFYESAKQEGLIEMLRTSYLDVRLMEKEKSDHIGRLQNVINKQKWSFEQSQDIAAEVDNLKMEISNFLNSSNNDSGMWERSSESISAGIGDDLHDIMDQLLRLRELLTSDCNCGLEEENKRLKQKNETLEAQIGEFRNRVTDLETTLLDKESLDTELQHEIDRKEEELNKIRQNLVALEETTSCHSATCETLSRKLQETEELLNSKSMQLVQMQQRCQEREKSIRELRSELDNAAQTYQENCKMKSEIAELTSQISAWQSQQCERDSRVRALEREMARLTNHCLHIDQCYKVKAQNVAELQAHLEEAHERGAVLCAEARHAVCAVRQWARRMRAKHKEQEAQIKEKESLLYAYQRQLQEKRIDAPRTSASEKDACIRCIPRTSERSDSYTSCLGARQKQSITASPSERDVCRKCNLRSESYTIMKDREQCESNCRKVSNKERREMSVCTSESEMASCSSVPVPPKRMYRKKQKCGEKRCECRSSSYSRDACVQLPIRRDAATLHSPQTPHPNNYDVGHVHIAEISRDLSSPTEELLNRVERLGEALADGQRRWTRGRHARTT